MEENREENQREKVCNASSKISCDQYFRLSFNHWEGFDPWKILHLSTFLNPPLTTSFLALYYSFPIFVGSYL